MSRTQVISKKRIASTLTKSLSNLQDIWMNLEEDILESQYSDTEMYDEVGEVPNYDARKNLKFEEMNKEDAKDRHPMENWRQKWPLFKIQQYIQRKGFLLLSAILEIGIIYGFIASLKRIEEKLWQNKYWPGIAFRAVYHINSYILHGFFLIISYEYSIASSLFFNFAPKDLQRKFLQVYRALIQWYFQEDEKLATQLTEFIEIHPWMKKTTLELLDELAHWIITKVEHIFGLPSKMTIMKTQIQKYQYLFSQFYQSHLESIPANFHAQRNGNAQTANEAN